MRKVLLITLGALVLLIISLSVPTGYYLLSSNNILPSGEGNIVYRTGKNIAGSAARVVNNVSQAIGGQQVFPASNPLVDCLGDGIDKPVTFQTSSPIYHVAPGDRAKYDTQIRNNGNCYLLVALKFRTDGNLQVFFEDEDNTLVDFADYFVDNYNLVKLNPHQTVVIETEVISGPSTPMAEYRVDVDYLVYQISQDQDFGTLTKEQKIDEGSFLLGIYDVYSEPNPSLTCNGSLEIRPFPLEAGIDPDNPVFPGDNISFNIYIKNTNPPGSGCPSLYMNGFDIVAGTAEDDHFTITPHSYGQNNTWASDTGYIYASGAEYAIGAFSITPEEGTPYGKSTMRVTINQSSAATGTTPNDITRDFYITVSDPEVFHDLGIDYEEYCQEDDNKELCVELCSENKGLPGEISEETCNSLQEDIEIELGPPPEEPQLPPESRGTFSSKTCIYAEGNSCYEGICRNPQLDCSLNVNCGYQGIDSEGNDDPSRVGTGRSVSCRPTGTQDATIPQAQSTSTYTCSSLNLAYINIGVGDSSGGNVQNFKNLNCAQGEVVFESNGDIKTSYDLPSNSVANQIYTIIAYFHYQDGTTKEAKSQVVYKPNPGAGRRNN